MPIVSVEVKKIDDITDRSVFIDFGNGDISYRINLMISIEPA
jgi:hypothetical protein